MAFSMISEAASIHEEFPVSMIKWLVHQVQSARRDITQNFHIFMVWDKGSGSVDSSVVGFKADIV
jgi:hypothetical protein